MGLQNHTFLFSYGLLYTILRLAVNISTCLTGILGHLTEPPKVQPWWAIKTQFRLLTHPARSLSVSTLLFGVVVASWYHWFYIGDNILIIVHLSS